MAGVAVSGVLWAIFQNNAGGAWDNAKKSFEAGVMIDGEMTYKGSEAHKAAVTGDTVGDPFKDTSGPSMNILIKLTCLVGLVIAPILGGGHESHAATTATEEVVEVRQEVMKMKLKDVAVRLDGAITGEATGFNGCNRRRYGCNYQHLIRFRGVQRYFLFFRSRYRRHELRCARYGKYER
jgi:hypothetical protein